MGGSAVGRILTGAAATALGIGLCIAASAGAHPGHGADAVTVDGDDFRYSPGTITVGVGDAVIWFWTGETFRNHSVTAHPGQAEQFDSDPAGPPDNDTHPENEGFTHTFTQEGSFTYYCKNHPTMRGTVEVVPKPAPIVDAKLRKLRVASRAGDVVARFRSSLSGDVVGRIAARRSGYWAVIRTFSHRVHRGKNEVKLPVRGLDEGRYRLSFVLYDKYDRPSNRVAEQFRI